MPSKSQKQRRLFGMVVAYKNGDLPNASQKVKDIAKGVTLKQARDFAKKVQQELDQQELEQRKIKLMDLINQDKVIQGKDYKITGFADKNSGNITFKIITRNPQILKAFRTQDFANAAAKVYKGGVKVDYYSFKPTFTLFSINSYDTSQYSIQKLMNIMRTKIQNISKF